MSRGGSLDDDRDAPERPPSMLFAQYALYGQAAFDVLAGVGAGAYYGWAMSLIPGGHWAVWAVSGVGPALAGLVLAFVSAAAGYGLSTRQGWAWVVALAAVAAHLVLNPCCAPLPLLILWMLLREDLRDWLE